MLEPILPILAVILSSLALLGLGFMAFVVLNRLPKPKNVTTQQGFIPSERDPYAEPVEVSPPTPFYLQNPLLQLSFHDSLDIQKYTRACKDSAISYMNEQLKLGLGDGIVVTINALRLKPSGLEMIFHASRNGQTLLDKGLAVLTHDKLSGQLLPVLKDVQTQRILEQFKGAPLATTASRLAALSAVAVSAAHIVAGADIARRLKSVEKKLDLLLAYRRIDQLATLERIYTSAKELTGRPMTQFKCGEIWRLRGELRELRNAWRREWEYHLNQNEDPNAENWFVEKFRQISIIAWAASPVIYKKKWDTRAEQSQATISEGQVELSLIEYSLRLDQLLAVASRTEKEFMVTLADELNQLEVLTTLLDKNPPSIVQKEKVEPVLKPMKEIVIQYRSLLPENSSLNLLPLSGHKQTKISENEDNLFAE